MRIPLRTIRDEIDIISRMQQKLRDTGLSWMYSDCKQITFDPLLVEATQVCLNDNDLPDGMSKHDFQVGTIEFIETCVDSYN